MEKNKPFFARTPEFIIVLFFVFRLHTFSHAETSNLKYINPFIGTGGGGFAQGNTVVGAAMPFGMVKAGPDTQGKVGRMGFAHCAGYWYEDKFIEGFSHMHMEGTGVADYGNILLIPTAGMDETKTDEKGYGSSYSHEKETAKPGYYSVNLNKHGIKAELTASEHGAIHRYTFPTEAKDNAVVIIDPSHALGNGFSKGVKIEINPEKNEISGYGINAGDFVGEGRAFTVYFSAAFDAPFKESGVWEKGKLFPGEKAYEKKENKLRAGAYFQFDISSGEPVVEARVGISFISAEQAKLNRGAELKNKSFEQVRKEAEKAWENVVRLVDVEGGTEKQKTIFYSALYHAFMMPTLFTDVNGKYVGLDGQVHETENFRYYTEFSLWDTYRTAHALYELLSPDIQRDMLVTLVTMMKQGGILPRWPLADSETSCMIGSPANMVFAESVLKGIRDFDVNAAYEGMKQQADAPPPPGSEGSGRDDIAECLKYNYCPADKAGSSVSKTQEYAYADFALAQIAKHLGKKDDYNAYIERSKWYKNLWDEKTQFFRGKTTDGKWADEGNFYPSEPLQPHYTEGNAWQYLFFVPFDVPGLISLFGSPDAFFKKLDEFFDNSVKFPAKIMKSGKTKIAMPDFYYWHGNEPDMHASYMYALAGRPGRGAKWIRWVMDTKYTDGPDGLNGNDDGGTLSAWYVFSAMGIYPLAGTDVYLIGSPAFEKSVVHLKGEKDFVILAEGASEQNMYIQSATLNGKPLNVPWFKHSAIANGGTLHLKMGSSPSEWGNTEPLTF